MKIKFFYFLLAAIILLSFQIFPSAAAETVPDLPDISILNIENPVPQERGLEKSLGREWVTVELKNYKVYYLPERGFPTDETTHKEYMKNINFLLPRLDNVYVFLSKWINVDLGRKLGVYYIADRNQLAIYSLANDINARIDKIIKKSENKLKNDPGNQYWSYMHNLGKSLRAENKEIKDVMNRVVSHESVLLNMLNYKKGKFINWLLDPDSRDSEFENILDKEIPSDLSKDIGTKKTKLCTKLFEDEKDFNSTGKINKKEVKKELMKKDKQIAELLFNNNPYYLAKIMDISPYEARQLLDFNTFYIGAPCFPLFQYDTYFNYAGKTPVIDLHESCHVFIFKKQCGEIDNKFLHDPLCLYFHFKAEYLFDSTLKNEKNNFYEITLKKFKKEHPFEFYLENTPFGEKNRDETYDEHVNLCQCVRFLYCYLEQKDRVKFYEFLQYMLGDKDKGTEPLSAQYALCKSFGLSVNELNKELNQYYDIGVVE